VATKVVAAAVVGKGDPGSRPESDLALPGELSRIQIEASSIQKRRPEAFARDQRNGEKQNWQVEGSNDI
jgi:hypothetical protein